MSAAVKSWISSNINFLLTMVSFIFGLGVIYAGLGATVRDLDKRTTYIESLEPAVMKERQNRVLIMIEKNEADHKALFDVLHENRTDIAIIKGDLKSLIKNKE